MLMWKTPLGRHTRNCLEHSVFSLHREKLLALSYNNRGHLKYLRVDFREAVEDYTRAVQCDEALGVAFYNRGLIHYRLGTYRGVCRGLTACWMCAEWLIKYRPCRSSVDLQIYASTHG